MTINLNGLKEYFSSNETNLNKIKFLVRFLRSNYSARNNFENLIHFIESDIDFKTKINSALSELIKNAELTSSFTETGIINNSSFSSELKNRIKHRILPKIQNENSLEFILSQIFYEATDYKWINEISDESWLVFLKKFNVTDKINNPHLISELLKALQIISYRVTSLSLENELKSKFEVNDVRFESFILQQTKINKLLFLIENNYNESEIANKANEIDILFTKCIDFINEIRRLKKIFGTSIYLTFLLLRIEQQIERAKLIIDLADANNNLNLYKLISFFKQNVESQNTQNHIKTLIADTTGYLAFQIVQHEGKTGEHYITETKKEYKKSFWAAVGGGLIISFTALIKAMFHFIAAPAFWQSVLYSVNYAVGFVVVYSLHWTIATKQPAMTASALASQLDKKNESPQKLAELIAKISRSQIASFAGNLLIVFPLSYLLAWLFFILFNVKVAGPEFSKQLILNQNPFDSGAWFYAAIAGFFLFLSGVITGYFDNIVIYSKIKKRIILHPTLSHIFSLEKRKKLANYIENNLGGLMGNITLGFFLGFAIFFGKIFGVPFDIRHVTISAANFGIAIFGLDNQLTSQQWVTTSLGIAGIGFINFATSFALALIVALKSRKFKVINSGEYLFAVLKLFIKRPLIFFYPEKKKLP